MKPSDDSRRTAVARRPWPFYAALSGEPGAPAAAPSDVAATAFPRARGGRPPDGRPRSMAGGEPSVR